MRMGLLRTEEWKFCTYNDDKQENDCRRNGKLKIGISV